MTQCRDWLRTLWPASYKGVPFYFESDDEEGGRDQIVHDVPHGDNPYIEDMGEKARYFAGTAYVHGDNVDSLESAFKAALVSPGAGTLVVPLGGPVVVKAMEFKRHHQRDQLGYVAFDVKFVREGAARALVSVASALNLAYVAVDALASIASAAFPASITVASQPDHVVSAVSDTLASAAATVDVMRTTYAVDPVASAAIRDAVSDIVAGVTPAPPAAAADVQGLAQALIDNTRAVGEAMAPASAARAMADMIDAFVVTASAQPYVTASDKRAADNLAAASRLARLAGLAAYADAILRTSYTARPDGVTARGEVAERFEAELYATFGAADAALYGAIVDLRDKVIDYLSRLINDLAPVVTVESARMLPALFLAWRLYSDPTRAAELVARNKVRHPAFMPRVISALAR